MQSVRLLRLCIQAVALAIFAYQMIVALEKYATFSSVPTEETKDIANAKLPDIYLCMEVPRNSKILKNHGYYVKNSRMNSYLEGLASGSGKSFFVSWEGINNQPYEKIIGNNVRNVENYIKIYIYKYNSYTNLIRSKLSDQIQVRGGGYCPPWIVSF